MPQPDKLYYFPKYKDPRCYFLCQHSKVFTEGRGKRKKKKGTSVRTVWEQFTYHPGCQKKGLKSRAHSPGLLLSLLYRAELHPEQMTRWLWKSMKSLRPFRRKRIPVYTSGFVRAENLFMLVPCRIPLQQDTAQTWLRGCRALTALWPTAVWGYPLHRGGGMVTTGRIPPSLSHFMLQKTSEEWKQWRRQLSCGSGFPWRTKINRLTPTPTAHPDA